MCNNAVIPTFGRLSQKDCHKHEASPQYVPVEKPCHEKKKK